MTRRAASPACPRPPAGAARSRRGSPTAWLAGRPCRRSSSAAAISGCATRRWPRVQNVTITGVTSSAEAPAIREALTNAAHDMTTLHVRVDALRRAVGPFPRRQGPARRRRTSRTRCASAVIQYKPVAVRDGSRARSRGAADGTLLRGDLASRAAASPRRAEAPAGGSTRRAPTPLDAVACRRGAPPILRPLVDAVGPRGGDGLQASSCDDGPADRLRRSDTPAREVGGGRAVLADPSAGRLLHRPARARAARGAGRFPTDAASAAPGPRRRRAAGDRDPAPAATTPPPPARPRRRPGGSTPSLNLRSRLGPHQVVIERLTWRKGSSDLQRLLAPAGTLTKPGNSS